LREKGVEALRRHLVNAKGRHIQVLMESEGRGRAADFTPVQIEAREGPGRLIDAVVGGHDGSALLARVRL
jgi:threonylcarbamoyladenosine tRNA methylthiotransferase MtaB